MSRVTDIFGEVYINATEELQKHPEQDVEYSCVEYFGTHPKVRNGDFCKFVVDLFNVASMRAPDTIKEFFKNRDTVVLEYDKEDKGAVLYILAKGTFGEFNYLVKATSANKYHKELYILEAVD
jgi:hypothetical protein